MANFINAADRVIMPIAIVPMTDEFNWDMHGQGWVLSSFAVGYISSQVTTGLGEENFVGLVSRSVFSLKESLIYRILLKLKGNLAGSDLLCFFPIGWLN
jgi:hypothetical protein